MKFRNCSIRLRVGTPLEAVFHARWAGFTLIEILVVISILGILAALLLPVLARAKARGNQAACINNFRQLAIGFQLYEGDSNDQFPAPGSAHIYGPQPEDWIWWQRGRAVEDSAIAKYVSGFNPKLFTCPMDTDAQRLQSQTNANGSYDPYRYSYSLTSYDLVAVTNADGDTAFNPGMSTIITKTREVYPFKHGQIRNPAAKIMLVEEDRATINDSRWVPIDTKRNMITNRHNGRGDVVFMPIPMSKRRLHNLARTRPILNQPIKRL